MKNCAEDFIHGSRLGEREDSETDYSTIKRNGKGEEERCFKERKNQEIKAKGR